MNKYQKEEQARRYRELMGDIAADRQAELAKSVCSSCGWSGGHHPACRIGRMLESRRKTEGERDNG